MLNVVQNGDFLYEVIMARDDNKLSFKEIETLEEKYLSKYWYFLKFVEDDIIKGFNTKNDIKSDWEGKYGNDEGGISDFAVGSERIIYALLNGKIAGQPNSAPVSSDLFFEIEDAYVHIDLKSVTTNGGVEYHPRTHELLRDNIRDFSTSIFVGCNQNSYAGRILKKSGNHEQYRPNLPAVYSKSNGDKKICLTYFVTILSNSATYDTEMITITCMPNGKLESHYGFRPLKAGKNPGKARFNFSEVPDFELLDEPKKRIRVIYKNPNMNDYVKERLDFLLHI